LHRCRTESQSEHRKNRCLGEKTGNSLDTHGGVPFFGALPGVGKVDLKLDARLQDKTILVMLIEKGSMFDR
jgi:hypothetical protein